MTDKAVEVLQRIRKFAQERAAGIEDPRAHPYDTWQCGAIDAYMSVVEEIDDALEELTEQS